MFKKKKTQKKRKRRRISKKAELIKAGLLIVLIAAAVRIFLVLPYRMPDVAMQSGYYSGDFLLVSKISYKLDVPAVGDVVVFEHPIKPGEKLARRIIAKEGQTVQVDGKIVYVDDQPIAEPSSVTHTDYRILPADFSNRDYSQPVKVPSGQVYVLADNRDQGEDSRNFGCVNLNSIKGKALFVYFSWAPDPNAPKMESPYIIPAVQIIFYNLFHFPSRVRWDRFFAES